MDGRVQPDWQTPPAELRLRAGGVDVWRIDLSAAPVEGLRTASWQATREILARYLGGAPAALRFARRPGGKPYLVSDVAVPAFNLSHSGGKALLAVSERAEVGVDLEAARPLADPLRLARRTLSAAEVCEIEALAATDRAAAFLDRWTRMEARQKAIGQGIFAAAADPAQLTSLVLAMPQGWFASLAVVGPGREPDLRFYDLRPG